MPLRSSVRSVNIIVREYVGGRKYQQIDSMTVVGEKPADVAAKIRKLFEGKKAIP